MSRRWIGAGLFFLVSTLAAAPGEMNGLSLEAEVAELAQLATESPFPARPFSSMQKACRRA